LGDAVARAQAANIVSHNATFGCSKCVAEGVYVRMQNERGGRTTFPNVNAEKRTNMSFRGIDQNRQAAHHHPGRSILEELVNFDMVRGIPDDPMHMFDIGVMKKSLIWIRMGRNTTARQTREKVRYRSLFN